MKIQPAYVERVREADHVDDLLPLVQTAIELEHATIPPYLCAFFSLKPGTNDKIAKILRSVAIEEMLHLTIASNLLLALGGSPSIDAPEFVPDYPQGLPMGIGDGFQVRLRKCSVEQVRDVFMKIEEPDDPIDIPVIESLSEVDETPPEFDTIGAFYFFLARKLEELGDAVFRGDPSRQVVPTKWFTDPDEMFPITNVASAVKGIGVIVDQGEGTSTNPFDTDGQPAHYYRFEQIVTGRELIEKPGADPPYAYGGDPVVLKTDDVWNMDDDPKLDKYREGSLSRRIATQFSYAYTKLLKSLHRTFNDDASHLDHAMGLMYEMRLLAHQALQTPAELRDGDSDPSIATGLCFEYQTLND